MLTVSCAVLFLALLSLTAFAPEARSQSPVEISDWYELNAVRDNLDGDFILVNDLDQDTPGYDDLASAAANGGAGWEPIGTDANRFTGSFDGNGHTISGLFIDRPGTNFVGLFGYVGSGGEVENVGLLDANVTGNWLVGGLVGVMSNLGGVSSSYSTGDVTGSDYVGGLVGVNLGRSPTPTRPATWAALTKWAGSSGGMMGRSSSPTRPAT